MNDFPKKDTRYDTCPICGGPKRTVAKSCKKCWRQPQNRSAPVEIDYSIATPEWLAEFAGLFWGEGSAMIVRNNTSYSPHLCICLRDDDAPMIKRIQEVLGGRILHSYLNKKNPNNGDMIEWRTTNLSHIVTIGQLLLQNSSFQAKKVNDLNQVIDFCTWRASCGRWFTDEERAEAERRFQHLRNSRKWKPYSS